MVNQGFDHVFWKFLNHGLSWFEMFSNGFRMVYDLFDVPVCRMWLRLFVGHFMVATRLQVV